MNSFTESRKPEPGGGHNDPPPLQHFTQYMQKCRRKIKFLLKINKNVNNKKIYIKL